MKFGKGTYHLDKLELRNDYERLVGQGAGRTTLIVQGGVKCLGLHPHIEGVKIVGEKNQGIGLYLLNNHRANVHNVEIVGFQRQMVADCTDPGRQWFHSYRDLYLYEAEGGGKSHYRDDCTGLELLFSAEKTTSGTFPSPTAFSNTFTVSKGYVNTQGSPLIVNGPNACDFHGVYFGGRRDPIRITKRSERISFYGCSAEMHGAQFQIESPGSRVMWFGNGRKIRCIDGDGNEIDGVITFAEGDGKGRKME